MPLFAVKCELRVQAETAEAARAHVDGALTYLCDDWEQGLDDAVLTSGEADQDDPVVIDPDGTPRGGR